MGRRRTLLAFPALVVATAALLACGGDEDPSAAPAEANYISVSWVGGFSTIGELVSASDLVVRGRVSGTLSERLDVIGDGSIPFTDFEVEVLEVLHGSIDAGSLTLHQTGGTAEDGILEVQDDPLLVEGEEYILGLKKGEFTDVYFVAGGPTGRLVVKDGKVSSLSAVYPDRNITDMGIRDLPLDDLRASMAAAAASP